MSDTTNNEKPPSWWKSLFNKPTNECNISSRDDLVDEIRHAQKKGLIAAEALGMIEGVMQVDNLQARDIMLSRSQITFIQRDSSYREILQQVMESGHSRYPVMDENRDDIEGILHAKDLLKYIGDEEDTFDIDNIVRPALFTTEATRLDELLREFKVKRNHMAVVVDEYGGISGVVTIEDVLEQIVGEIDDEHDIDEKPNIQDRNDNTFVINALTPIEEFNAFFKSTFDTLQFDTIGGLVTHQMGKIPHQGEELLAHDYKFTVLSSDGRRIQLLQVETLQSNDIGNKEKEVA